MIMGSKDKIGAAILSKMRMTGGAGDLKKDTSDAFGARAKDAASDMPEAGPDEGKKAAAEEFISAVKAEDADGVLETLESLMELIKNSPESEPSEALPE
jgi:hypothetical protein